MSALVRLAALNAIGMKGSRRGLMRPTVAEG
jgi:hypothetical protein